MSDKNLHPFLKIYFNTDINGLSLDHSLEEYFKNNPTEPVLESLLALSRSRLVYYKNIQQLLEDASKVSLENVELNLAVFYLIFWYKIARVKKPNESIIIKKKINAYEKEKRVHPITKAAIELLKISELPIKEQFKLIPPLIAKFDFSYGYSEKLISTFIGRYCQLGFGEKLSTHKPYINIKILQNWQSKFMAGYLINNLALVNTDHIKEYLKGKKNETKFIDPNIFALINFFDERKKFNIKEHPSDHPQFSNLLECNVLLLNQNEKRAYEICNKDLLLKPIKASLEAQMPLFLTQTLIRVALANRQTNLVKLLIDKMRTEIEHYIDDFYLARIELLEGNREKAAQYFNRCIKQCKEYKAENLLDLEIDLATEMSPSDLFYMTNYSNKNKSKKNLIETKNINDISSIQTTGIKTIIGISQKITELKNHILKRADLDIPVIIRGETGVGKDVAARAIHKESKRKKEPFLAINCGAISENLLQSELFGHTEGSYTGANKETKGVFLTAGKGTVFLDEIGEISQAVQVALLRVLEANEIRPVGSATTVPCHCRLLFATNAPLEKLVEENKFRRDLYYRLIRLSINIPALNERLEDVPILIEHFLKEFSITEELPIIDTPLMDFFCSYHWPGNIRELKNEIERICLLNPEKTILKLTDCSLVSGKQETLEKEEIIVENAPTLENHNNPRRRLKHLKDLFVKHEDLTRVDVMTLINVSGPTATNLLKQLMDENFIEKIKPKPAPRTHYFVLADQSIK